MAQFLRTASPGTFFLFSAVLGVVMAWLASMIPGLDMNFLTLAGILIALDVVTYIAMKAGWMRTPRQRSGIDP